MNELEDYLGVKLISACPMNLGDYNNFKGWKIPENEDPTKLGYLVKYNPEYISWSPKEVFEKAYRPTTGLNFGLALEALKLGEKNNSCRLEWQRYVLMVKTSKYC